MKGQMEMDGGPGGGGGAHRSGHMLSADRQRSAACTQVNNGTSPLGLVKLAGRWLDEGHSQKIPPASQLIRKQEEQRRGSISSKRGLPC